MAVISLPNTFADGSTASSDDAMENFYDPSASTFEKVNGHLDNGNRIATWGDVNFQHIRPRALSSGEMVGKTEPIDFLGGDSEASIFNPKDEDLPNIYTPISGASIEFYLPDDPTAVVFTWQIFISTDVSFTGKNATPPIQTNLLFFLDGTSVPAAKRALPFMFLNSGASTLSSGTYQTKRQRNYSGHHIATNLTAGWHSASLQIWASANLSRVRVRNMKYIRLK